MRLQTLDAKKVQPRDRASLDFDRIPPRDCRNNEAMRGKRKLTDGNFYAFT